MKDKVSELEGEKLAEWAARTWKWELSSDPASGELWWVTPMAEGCIYYHFSKTDYRPDINGGQAMELQKRFLVDVLHNEHNVQAWACVDVSGSVIDNPIDCFAELGQDEIAICRAVVASEYGEYVEDK